MLRAKEKFKNLLLKKKEKEKKMNPKFYTKTQKNKMKLLKFLKSNLPKIKNENPFFIKKKSKEILTHKIIPHFKIKNREIKKNHNRYSLGNFERLSTIGKYNKKLLNKSGNFIIKIKNKNLKNEKIEHNYLIKEKDAIYHEINKKKNKFIFFKKITLPPKIKKVLIKLKCDINSFPLVIQLSPWYIKTNSKIFLNEEKTFFKEFNTLRFKIEKYDNYLINSEIRFLNINILVLNSDKIDFCVNYHNPAVFSDFCFNEKIFYDNENNYINLKKKKKENLNKTNYIKYNKMHMRNKSEKILKINSFFLNDKKKIEKILKKKKIIIEFNYYIKRINQYKIYIKLNNVY